MDQSYSETADEPDAVAALGQDARLSDSTGAALLKEAGSVVGSHRQGVAGNQSRVRGHMLTQV